MATSHMQCGGCGARVRVGPDPCRRCRHRSTCRLKIFGPPEEVPQRVVRGLAQRGYDQRALEAAIRVEEDGVVLEASEGRLSALLRFVEGAQLRYALCSLDSEGQPLALAVASEGPPKWAYGAAAAGLVVLGGLGLWLQQPKPRQTKPQAPPTVTAPAPSRPAPADSGPKRPARPAKEAPPKAPKMVAPGVTKTAYESARRASVLLEIPGPRRASGLLVSKNHVLTLRHLVKGARSVAATTQDGHTFELTPTRNRDALFVVLQGTPPAEAQIEPVEFGHATSVEKGARIFSIGGPMGGDFAANPGVVTQGLTKVLGKPCLKTDANVGPPHAGGGVFDSEGILVAINTNRSGRGEVGYAHYVETARDGPRSALHKVLGLRAAEPGMDTLLAETEEKGGSSAWGLGSSALVEASSEGRKCPRRKGKLCASDVELQLFRPIVEGAPRLSGGLTLRFSDEAATSVVGRVLECDTPDRVAPSLRRKLRAGVTQPLERCQVLVSGWEIHQALGRKTKGLTFELLMPDGATSAATLPRL